MANVSVTRVHSELERSVWSFFYYDRDNVLYLDSYIKEARETPAKRKYQPLVQYDRIRHNGMTGPGRVEVDKVPLPDEIVAEAKQKLFESITVKKWEK